MTRLDRLLRIQPGDRDVLLAVAPVFGLITATNVVVASSSRALYLASKAFSAIPWMYVAAAAFTMVASLAYVGLLRRASGGARMSGLVLFAAASFAAWGLIAPLDPERAALPLFAWCAALGQLLVIQSWSWTAYIIPTRQARRLFPLLSAAATLGAAAGGALAGLSVVLGGVERLLFLGAGVLVLTAWVIGRSRARLAALLAEARESGDPPTVERQPTLHTPRTVFREALDALRRIPLLAHVAALAFLDQSASVLMDFQFSAALKHGYGAEEMAGLLGLYYLGANGLTFVIAVGLAGRLTHRVGLGLAAASSDAVLLVGSLVVVALAAVGALGPGLAFGLVAATSFGERVADFSLSRQAMKAATLPVDPTEAEPARLLIDGVINRIAILLVSGALLIVGEDLSDYVAFSPALALLAGAAVVLGWTLGPRYRDALLAALASRRLGPDRGLPDWALVESRRVVGRLLQASGEEDVQRGLALAREVGVRLDPADIARLLEGRSPEAVARLLAELDAGDLTGANTSLGTLLAPDQPPPVIVAALRLLPRSAADWHDAVEALSRHPDPAVAARAVVWLHGPSVRGRARERLRRHARALTDPFAGPRQLAPPTTPPDDPLERRYHELVDRIPDLLGGGVSGEERLALDLLVDLALPEHAAWLVDALEDPDRRAVARLALGRMPAAVVLPHVARRLADPELPDVMTTRLLQIAERAGGPGAWRVLVDALDDPRHATRDQAVRSMWRLAGGALPAASAADPALLRRHVMAEVDRLVQEAVVDRLLADRPGPRLAFVRREIRLRRARGEDRMLRLLALLYGRRPLESVLRFYRSPDRRKRANAIELLDTTLRDPRLKVVVDYVETTGQRRVDAGAPGTGMMQSPALVRALRTVEATAPGQDPVEALLAGTDPWLARLYRWARTVETDREDRMAAIETGDVMERVFLLRGVTLFDEVPAEQLLALAEVARSHTMDAGTLLFEGGEEGHELYIIVEGRVRIERDGQEVAVLGARECVGEMALLDDSPRSAAARAIDPTTCLVVDRTDFDDLLDAAPGMARGIIRVLTRRLRDNLEQRG